MLLGVRLPDNSILKDKNGTILMFISHNAVMEWLHINNYPITEGMDFIGHIGECAFCGKPRFKDIKTGQLINCTECDGTFKF